MRPTPRAPGRLSQAIGIGCVLGCACLILGCGRQGGPSPEALGFWTRFLETNRAWLDPQPGPLALEFALQQKEYDPATATYDWYESGDLRSWSTLEKDLRIIQSHRFDARSPFRTNEYRYVRGKGGRVELKPGASRSRPLGLEFSLAGRTGAGFLSSLHLCAAWGLPGDALVKDGEGPTVSLLLTNAFSRPREWRRETTLELGYGSHPAIFASVIPVVPHSAEAIIDRVTLLPLSLTETERSGRVAAKVSFDPVWLDLNGHKVPSRIRCELPASARALQYDFTIDQGVWALKQFTREYPGAPSLCARTILRRLQVGPIPGEHFPGPADLEIPEHSYTRCAPGERLLRVRTTDGLELEGKLSLPPSATSPVPVVMFLPGAGPWSFDRPLVYPDLAKLEEMPPPRKVYNYCDFFAREFSARGIGFFRMNKRGCGIVRDEEGYPQEICNRRVFSGATPSVLLRDYQAALEMLRRAQGVDASRLVLLGGSEGTRLAPRLALASPEGIRAVVMLGYAGDNTHDTIVWQQRVGPWRNLARLFDEDNNNQITRAEYEAAVGRVGKALRDALPFEQLDANHNGIVVPGEMDNLNSLKRILKAFQEGDDDYLWENLVQLSTAYLAEDWQSPPLYQTLLQLELPLAIFHGESDGSCRVECAREAQRAFARAAKDNLNLRTYPKADHDLNWARFLKDGKVPQAFREMFDYIEERVR